MDNAKWLNILIESYDWEIWCDKPFYDIGVFNKNQGQLIKGRGSDKSPLVATLKAFCEFIERFNCSKRSISSNGTAAHFNEDNAIQNATKELIERHMILYHIQKNQPFTKLEYKAKYLAKVADDVNLEFFSTYNCNGIRAYIIRGKLIKRRGFVYIVGTSLDQDLEIQFLRKYVSLLEHDFEAENTIQDNCLNNNDYAFDFLFSGLTSDNVSCSLTINTETTQDSFTGRVYFARALSEEALSITSTSLHFIG